MRHQGSISDNPQFREVGDLRPDHSQPLSPTVPQGCVGSCHWVTEGLFYWITLHLLHPPLRPIHTTRKGKEKEFSTILLTSGRKERSSLIVFQESEVIIPLWRTELWDGTSPHQSVVWKVWTLEPKGPGFRSLPLAGCVALSISLYDSVLQFSHLKNRDDNNTCLTL